MKFRYIGQPAIMVPARFAPAIFCRGGDAPRPPGNYLVLFFAGSFLAGALPFGLHAMDFSVAAISDMGICFGADPMLIQRPGALVGDPDPAGTEAMVTAS